MCSWQNSRNTMAPEGETKHGNVVEDDDAAATESHESHGLAYLQRTARERLNVFDVGGEYRRNTCASGWPRC